MLVSSSQVRRSIPSVDALLKTAHFARLTSVFGRPQVVACLRELLADQRRRLSQAHAAAVPDQEALAAECGERLAAAARP